MRTGSRGPLIVLVLLLAAFGAGVGHLFLLRFSAGDVLPAYSSLRSDPLGVKALYESLESLPGTTVFRNFRPLDRLVSGRGIAVFRFGARAGTFEEMPEAEAKGLKATADSGGRLVVAFLPEAEEDEAAPPRGPRGSPEWKTDRKTGDGGDAGRSRPRLVDLTGQWGFRIARSPLPEDREKSVARMLLPDGAGSAEPVEIPWRSALVFDNLVPAWTVLCERNGRPVIVERAIGRGTIVLSSDAYFLSNEAMRRHRRPGLLVRLAGECRTIVFDETHLGVAEGRTVVSLARKYRLHGLLGGILLLSALCVWKKAAPFLPPRQDGPGAALDGPAAGKDSRAAFVNLLRRSIPPGALLEVCFEEWIRSFPRIRRSPGDRLDRARAVVAAEKGRPPGVGDPPAGYRIITRILRGEHGER